MNEADSGLQLNAAEVEKLSQLVVELRYREALPFIQVMQEARQRAQIERMKQKATSPQMDAVGAVEAGGGGHV